MNYHHEEYGDIEEMGEEFEEDLEKIDEYLKEERERIKEGIRVLEEGNQKLKNPSISRDLNELKKKIENNPL